MITRKGYSKDRMIIPEGIVITWGKDMIQEKGGLLTFIRFFRDCMSAEDSIWMQKCRNRPRKDKFLQYVYIIVHNRVHYRGLYGGYRAEPVECYLNSWSSRQLITWPHIIICGPIETAPMKIIRPGFQGFRYSEKLF